MLQDGDGRLSAADRGLLREDRRVADKLGGDLAAVIIAGEIADAEKTIGGNDGERFYRTVSADHPEVCAALLAELVQNHRPRLFLALATSFGADVMPRLAAAAATPSVTDCIDIESAGEITFTKPLQGGRLHAVIATSGDDTCLAILAPNYLPKGDGTSAAQRTELCEVASDAASIATRLDIVERALADSVLVMKEGLVVEQGTTEAIFANPRERYTQELMRAAFVDDAA